MPICTNIGKFCRFGRATREVRGFFFLFQCGHRLPQKTVPSEQGVAFPCLPCRPDLIIGSPRGRGALRRSAPRRRSSRPSVELTGSGLPPNAKGFGRRRWPLVSRASPPPPRRQTYSLPKVFAFPGRWTLHPAKVSTRWARRSYATSCSASTFRASKSLTRCRSPWTACSAKGSSPSRVIATREVRRRPNVALSSFCLSRKVRPLRRRRGWRTW